MTNDEVVDAAMALGAQRPLWSNRPDNRQHFQQWIDRAALLLSKADTAGVDEIARLVRDCDAHSGRS